MSTENINITTGDSGEKSIDNIKKVKERVIQTNKLFGLLKNAKEKLDSNDLELQSKEEKIVVLDTRIKTLETQLSTTQAILEDERKKSSEPKEPTQQHDIKAQTDTIVSLQTEVESLNKVIASKNMYAQQLEALNADLKQQSVQKKPDTNATKNQEKHRSEIAKKNAQIVNLEGKLKLAEAQKNQSVIVDSQKKEIEALEKQLSEFRTKNEELEDKISTLDDEIWALRIDKKMDSDEDDDDDEPKEKEDSRIKELEKEKTELINNIESLKVLNKKYETEQREHSTRSEHHINHLTTQNKALEANITSFKSTKSMLEETITKLENQNRILKQKANSSRASTPIKESHTSATSANSERMLKAIHRLKAENMSLQETVSSLQASNRKLNMKQIENKSWEELVEFSEDSDSAHPLSPLLTAKDKAHPSTPSSSKPRHRILSSSGCDSSDPEESSSDESLGTSSRKKPVLKELVDKVTKKPTVKKPALKRSSQSMEDNISLSTSITPTYENLELSPPPPKVAVTKSKLKKPVSRLQKFANSRDPTKYIKSSSSTIPLTPINTKSTTTKPTPTTTPPRKPGPVSFASMSASPIDSILSILHEKQAPSNIPKRPVSLASLNSSASENLSDKQTINNPTENLNSPSPMRSPIATNTAEIASPVSNEPVASPKTDDFIEIDEPVPSAITPGKNKQSPSPLIDRSPKKAKTEYPISSSIEQKIAAEEILDLDSITIEFIDACMEEATEYCHHSATIACPKISAMNAFGIKDKFTVDLPDNMNKREKGFVWCLSLASTKQSFYEHIMEQSRQRIQKELLEKKSPNCTARHIRLVAAIAKSKNDMHQLLTILQDIACVVGCHSYFVLSMYNVAAIWKECLASDTYAPVLKETLQVCFAYSAKSVKVPANATGLYTKIATLCEWQALPDTPSLLKKSEDNLALLLELKTRKEDNQHLNNQAAITKSFEMIYTVLNNWKVTYNDFILEKIWPLLSDAELCGVALELIGVLGALGISKDILEPDQPGVDFLKEKLLQVVGFESEDNTLADIAKKGCLRLGVSFST